MLWLSLGLGLLSVCKGTRLEGSADVILPPVEGKTGDASLMIFIQGASIPTKGYQPIGAKIQEAFDSPLWFAAPQCPEDTAAIPGCIKSGVGRIMDALEKKGVSNIKSVFFAGHSLGGAMVQDYVASNMKEDVKGMVLLGSFLTRKYKKNRFPNTPQYEFPVPTLTVGGELDGLSRITRITESLHTQVTMSASKHPERELPVVVLPGVSHMQFASGTPPSLVKKRDLRAEVTEEEAHDAIASDVAAFLSAVIGNTDESWAKVEARVKESTTFTQPIVDAFNMEAYHQFLPPCLCEAKDEYGYMEYGTCQSNATCTGGTPWTAKAQQILGGGLEGLEMTVVDSSHIVTEERPSCHLPHIHGNLTDSAANPGNGKSPPLCDSPKGCTLNITTVTQQMYQSAGEFDWWRIHFNLSSADTGYLMESATELKAKLKSRQSIWEAAGVPNVNYTASDVPTGEGGDGDRCAEINAAAIEWAMSVLPKTTKDRFMKYGNKITIGPDQKTCIAGPCWIFDPLKWEEDKKTGDVTVKSVWLGEKNKNIYPCGEGKTLPCDAGFHYCKLLSPARVVEWAYVDGLRKNYGI
mmetsp:Transcript_3814/g.5919  ORF Transcript_3814/g.5919 Transcript_3814/m.5919 type:complete len:579 (+) Transcript_3814:59-1795(+)